MAHSAKPIYVRMFLLPQYKLGDTPLHNAAWKGHTAVVEVLLEKHGGVMCSNCIRQPLLHNIDVHTCFCAQCGARSSPRTSPSSEHQRCRAEVVDKTLFYVARDYKTIGVITMPHSKQCLKCVHYYHALS